MNIAWPYSVRTIEAKNHEADSRDFLSEGSFRKPTWRAELRRDRTLSVPDPKSWSSFGAPSQDPKPPILFKEDGPRTIRGEGIRLDRNKKPRADDGAGREERPCFATRLRRALEGLFLGIGDGGLRCSETRYWHAKRGA
jgi:hypothetical protein